LIKKRFPLRDAADLIVREAFMEIREMTSLDKLMLSANEVLDPRCQDNMNWKTVRF